MFGKTNDWTQVPIGSWCGLLGSRYRAAFDGYDCERSTWQIDDKRNGENGLVEHRREETLEYEMTNTPQPRVEPTWIGIAFLSETRCGRGSCASGWAS